jgi:hypothetical protein
LPFWIVAIVSTVACMAALVVVMLLIYWSPLFWTGWVWLWN